MTASRFWALILGLIAAGAAVIGWVLYAKQHPDMPQVVSLLQPQDAQRRDQKAPPAPASVPAVPPAASTPSATADDKPKTTETTKPEIAKEESTPPKAEPASGHGEPPHFDVVRVEPSGEAVVAGKGDPDSKVALVNAGKVVAEAKTDSNGQFVLLPPPLTPGDHDLSLRETPQGKAPVESKQNVAVSVPKKGGDKVVVALAEPGKPTKVLAGPPETKSAAVPPPAPAPAAAPPAARPPTAPGDKVAVARPETTVTPPAGLRAADVGLAIGTVELENGNGFFATGVAAAGTHIEVYLNGSHLAQVVSGADRAWSVTIKKGLAGGHYAVRADAVDGKSVIARVEVHFDVPVAMAAAPTPAALPKPAGGPSNKVAAVPPQDAAKPAETGATPPPSAEAPKPADQPPAKVAEAPAQPEASKEADKSPAKAAEAPAQAEAPKAADRPTEKVVEAPSPAGAPKAADKPPEKAAEAPTQAEAPKPADVAAAPKTESASPGEAAKPATPGTSHAVVEQVETTKVVRGDNLWDISRVRLGNGMRYTQIYTANATQIRNPNLIYPGQVFVMPQP